MAKKLQFNSLVTDTFARLQAVSILIGAFDAELPDTESGILRRLKARAEVEGWQFEEFAVERGIISNSYEVWIPLYAAYSVVILLYSIIESQLTAFADYLGTSEKSNIRVVDIAGKGIDRSAHYLDCVLGLRVKDDEAWPRLKEIQTLRNCIMHSNGKRQGEFRRKIEGIALRHQGLIEFRSSGDCAAEDQIWISLSLCMLFLADGRGFFERQFRLAGFSSLSVSDH